MAQLGLTTTAGNAILDAYCQGVPLVSGVVTIQLHDNPPGDDGTDNVFAGATRQAATYNAADAGANTVAGGGPLYNITAGGTVKYASAWTGFEGDGDAYCFATGVLLAPRTLANGDQFNLATAPISWEELAA